MTDLDEAVRHHLSRVVDTAPMAPSLQSIVAQSPIRDRAGTRWQIAAGGLAAVGASLWLAVTLLAPTVSEIEAADGPTINFGPGVLLELPEVIDTSLLLANLHDDLLAGNSYPTSESWQLEITRTRADDPEPEMLLEIPTGGILTSLDVSGDVILAVVSQHVTGSPPLVVISADAGDTWSQHELPRSESNDPQTEDAANGGAIGDDTLAVAGTTGVWSSDDGSDWQFTQLVTIDPAEPVWRQAYLNSIVWDGTSFIAAGGVDDPEAGDSGDSDPAFWRSVDGREWSEPQVVYTDAAIRSSSGVDHLTTDGEGTVVAMTATQQWQGGSVDALDRGTLILVSTGGEPFTATHLSDWLLYDTFPTEWGFMAAGVNQDRLAEPRLLLSTDGRRWKDIGPAPGMSAAGIQWGTSVVINGPTVESGSPNLSWQLSPQADSTESTLVTSSTTTQVPERDQFLTTLGPGQPPSEESD